MTLGYLFSQSPFQTEGPLFTAGVSFALNCHENNSSKERQEIEFVFLSNKMSILSDGEEQETSHLYPSTSLIAD